MELIANDEEDVTMNEIDDDGAKNIVDVDEVSKNAVEDKQYAGFIDF